MRPRAVVDCVVAADEMPNLPHIDLETVGNFAVAKIREALLAVTGAVTTPARSAPTTGATGALPASWGANKQPIRIVFELHA
jgi:hypothetical protein